MTGLAHAGRALRHRNFRIFFIGQTTSLTGTWMQNVAQAWLVYRLTHSELLLGMAGFLTHLPTLLLGPLGGVVADRFERRKIVIATQILFLAQATLLAFLTLTHQVTVTHVLILSAVQGLGDAFDRPARQAMLIQLAGQEDLLNAISLNSMMFNLARIVGPSLGGLMVASFGEGACFSLNAVSFLAVLGGLLMIRVPAWTPGPSQSAFAHLLEGFRYVARSRQAWPFLAVNAIVNFAAAPVWVLLPFFADSIFHQGSAGVGYLTGSMGLGAVIGMIGLASRRSVYGMSRIVLVSTVLLALGMAGFAVSPLFALSALFMGLIGFSVMRQNSATNTALQSAVPEALRGRVMGMFATANVGMLPLGSLAGGALAQVVGAQWVVFAGALICLGGAVFFRSTAPVEAS